MTPRSHSSPSIGHTSPPPSEEEDEINNKSNKKRPEERPIHTSEIGTLKKLPNHGTAWLGSSSGVYFVNTVRRAFSAAFAANSGGANAVPASEDILTGEDAEGRSYNGPITEGPSATDGLPRMLSSALGRPPERKIAVELVMSFFQAWHPLFPFLHGPTFLKDMETLYSQPLPTTGSYPGSHPPSSTAETAPDLRKIVTFQLIINIASLDRSDIHLSAESRIKSTADVARLASSMALNHDLATIQTLLAAELYLVATLAIRQASTVAGIIVKLIYHAGLHRCPLRYAQLSLDDCEIRKRIFWSAYALDRHCNLSLGDPNVIQDDDIDVCLSGPELHKAVARDLLTSPEQEIGLHMANPHAGLASGPVSDDPRVVTEGPEAQEKRLREAALTAFVQWGKLTGRIIEIFHKSINHRFPKHEQILRLTSDIETWWNNLPSFLTGEDSTDTAPHQQHLSSFFKILYHRLLLLVNRPRLSLDQSTPEFQHGLQVCIRASRNILAGLKSHKSHGQSMFLPGLLSATWMSGLIIAFACQLGKYAKVRACSDIQGCLSILESMNPRWYTVQNCHKVLGLLLANIQSRKASSNGFLAVVKPEQGSSQPTPPNDGGERPAKRARANPDDLSYASPRKGSVTDAASSSTDSPIQLPNSTPTGLPPPRAKQPASVWGPTTYDAMSNGPNFDFSNWDRGQPTTNPGFNPGIGAAVYATPQDMWYAQSNMTLPELPTNAEDPMFWGNIDYNVTDIFGSATWENMTGPFAPGWDQNLGP